MPARYTRIYTQKLKTDLKKISSPKARAFLLKYGYSSSSFKMPPYYKPANLNKINLKKINWNSKHPVTITSTLDIITPKSFLSWRSFNFLNPYIFLLIVQEITSPKNWKKVQSLLTSETLIYSYSTPNLSLSGRETVAGKSILNWLQMAEKDLIKDCTDFNHLIVTDINNFYPSIYTHSIAWAVDGKSKIKKNRFNYNFLGNKLDKLFQNANDGQTNGIPVGAMVSDIIAEIILLDVDKKLSKAIKDDKLSSSILVARYRDDYRILSKTEEDGKKVLLTLNQLLQKEYNLHLNSDKTHAYKDIIEGSFRPWMQKIKNSVLLRNIYHGDVSESIDSAHLKDCLLETYRLQLEYPDGRVSISILSKLADGLYKHGKTKFRPTEIPEIIAILREITLLREEVTPYAFILFDILLTQITYKTERIKLFDTIKKTISGKDDKEYQLIWFYRLCLSFFPQMCDDILRRNKCPLLRVVEKKYYKYDNLIFDNKNFTKPEMSELKKFIFINQNKLNASKNKRIDPKYVNVFKY